jgi:hypothetical protein
VPVLTLGLRALLQRTPEEIGWSAYRALGRVSPTESDRPTIQNVALAPLPGGALASVTFSR